MINEMSNRATPTLVSFNGRERAIGEAAQGQLGVNPKNTANGVSVPPPPSLSSLPQLLEH